MEPDHKGRTNRSQSDYRTTRYLSVECLEELGGGHLFHLFLHRFLNLQFCRHFLESSLFLLSELLCEPASLVLSPRLFSITQ